MHSEMSSPSQTCLLTGIGKAEREGGERERERALIFICCFTELQVPVALEFLNSTQFHKTGVASPIFLGWKLV